jgi:curved DNA-binding protein CbpA
LKQIKQAFKKKALKLHPDVNKAVSSRHSRHFQWSDVGVQFRIVCTIMSGSEMHACAWMQPDAKDRFMECKAAYQTLSDTRERAKYDRFGVSTAFLSLLLCTEQSQRWGVLPVRRVAKSTSTQSKDKAGVKQEEAMKLQ